MQQNHTLMHMCTRKLVSISSDADKEILQRYQTILSAASATRSMNPRKKTVNRLHINISFLFHFK